MKSIQKLQKHNQIQIPKELYHYTTQDGLLGILSNWEIWATKIQYLNDTSEFQLALELAKDSLSKLKKKIISDQKRKDIQIFLDEAEAIRHLNIFVSSFSEGGDSLSQWRGYGGVSSSYAIGFRSSHLQTIAGFNNFVLARCIYNEDEQFEIVNDLVNDVVDEDLTVDGGDDLSKFLYHLMQIAPLLKNKYFKEEKEWRLISKAIVATDPKFSFRKGLSSIVPYYRIPLSINNESKSVESINIGPCPDTDIAIDAVRMFTYSKGIISNNIHNSEIPYRNW